MNADSTREKLETGASLVQLQTGFVCNGPGSIRDIAVLRTQATSI
jgi:dihydroorotate dehydrogenase